MAAFQVYGREGDLQDDIQLAGQVELARVVDLSAQRLGLRIEYDARTLQGQTITLRETEAIDAESLWQLANQLLAARGMTSVQLPGSETISIVRLGEAAGLARLEPDGVVRTKAGFASLLVDVHHRPASEFVDIITPFLSRTGGSVQAVADGNRLLIADLRPRLEQVLPIVRSVDTPSADTHVEQIPAQFMQASQLAALVTSAVAARNAQQRRPLQGKLTPLPDGSAVMLVAPAEERAAWIALIAELDRRQEVQTRTYTPGHLRTADVARLIEQTAREPLPRGSGDAWRVVNEDLTGTLIVTATPAEHERIHGLLERLDEIPVEARRPVRSFSIRNRGVREVADVLTQLMDAGVFRSGRIESPSNSGTGGRAAASQQSSLSDARSSTQRISASDDATPESPVADARSALPGASGTSGGSGGSEEALRITVDEGTNTLIAIGDARLLAQLEELIKTLDVRQPQVMIEVLFLSLTDSQARELGFELEKLETSGQTQITLASLFGLGEAGAIPTAAQSGRGFTGLVLRPGDYRVLVRALENLNRGRALNVPKLLVSNNEQATLNSVLQQPFSSLVVGQTVSTTAFGGTQDAGTTVHVTPQIAEGDHLVLDYSVAVSSFTGQPADPALPPPRQQSTVESVVTIPDGHIIAVGGLDVQSDSNSIAQLPLIARIPIIGEVFKNRSTSVTRSQFYVFIRADVLRHEGFADLRYVSDQQREDAGLDDSWPKVEPRIIH